MRLAARIATQLPTRMMTMLTPWLSDQRDSARGFQRGSSTPRRDSANEMLAAAATA